MMEKVQRDLQETFYNYVNLQIVLSPIKNEWKLSKLLLSNLFIYSLTDNPFYKQDNIWEHMKTSTIS